MEKVEMALDYEVDVDGTVVDGRLLAAQLIVDAWRLLIPYAKNCPACTGKLFEVLANDALAEAEDKWRESGKADDIRLVRKGAEAGMAEAFEAHRLKTEEITKGFLARAPSAPWHSGPDDECGNA